MGVRPLSVQSGASREIADGTALLVPRVATLPASPTQGDTVVLTTDGLLYVYDGSAWVAAGVSSREVIAFESTSLANEYTLSSSSACPGAADFVAIALVVPFRVRDAAKWMPIIDKRNGSTGWWVSWNYGSLAAQVFTAAGGILVSCPTTQWPSDRRQGELHVVGLRVFNNAGTPNAELWIGPNRYAGPSNVGATTVSPNSSTALRCLDGVYFGDEIAAQCHFSGFGYYEGTVTDSQMRRIMGAAQARGELPTDIITWTNLFVGAGVEGVPSTWSPVLGTPTLSKNGSPASARAFFPPGGASNNVIVGAASSNLVIGPTEPTPSTGQQVLWVDTSGGNVSLNLVTGD